ncbi:MAG: WG repeat-containing protein, partial [Bacteroidota bacterium]
TYIVPPGYADISFFNDSLLVFENNGQYGLMRRNCSIVQPAQFDEIGAVYQDRALFVIDGLFGFLDGKGTVVLQPIYEVYPNYLTKGSFRNNHAVVRTKGKFGMIDRNGKTVIPFQYTELGEFSNLIAFSKGKLWGYIDPTGKEVIKPEFDRADSFQSGQAIAEKLTLLGVIDSKNKIILPFMFNSIDRLGEMFYLVSSGAKFGVFDSKGNRVLPIEYEQIRKLDDNILILSTLDEIHYFYISENRIIRLNDNNE